MRIKTKFIFGAIIIAVAGLLYYFWYLGGQTQAYDDIPDLSNEYNVDSEVAKAQEALNGNIEPATVYTKDPSKNVIALTFDGMPDPVTAKRLVDLTDEYDINVTFFVEGSNCAENKDTLLLLSSAKHVYLGNYTYTGLQRLDKLPADSVLDQFIKTQKVMSVITGKASTIFKAPDTSYVVPFLKIAAASGLKSAVKTDVFVNKDAVKTDADAVNFINSVPQGSIVSLVVGSPVNAVVYQASEVDEEPAVDKQPNLNLNQSDNVAPQHENIVDVTERLFKAIKARNITTVSVTELKEIKRADVLTPQPAPAQNQAQNQAQQQGQQQQPAPQQQPTQQQAAPQPTSDNGSLAMLFKRASNAVDNFVFSRAYAASPDYDELRAKNKHKLAQPQRMIYTTDQAVAFVFAGLSKPQVVYNTLDYLQKSGSKGTFFVMENEIKANPKLIQDIVNSGNEVAIGLRSLKNSDYYTTCRQITNVQTQLAKLGVHTNLVMQPWGQITDDTKEAVSAMGYQLYAPTVNIVNSKHQNYTSADDVMNAQFGKFVYSVGRGWIVYFRLDYYNDDNLVVNVMDLVKRHKVDNIAYNSFYDDPKVNKANDSAYAITSIGNILADKSKLYDFAAKDKVYPTDGNAYKVAKNDLSFKDFIDKRYIGNHAIEDDNVYGFNVGEKRYRDLTGKIHTDKPVVFFTFDDWGTDMSINHLLYVLRKHNAKGTFFVLTHNVMNNPNLLRAIAEDGQDVASHSEFHKPMDNTKYDIAYAKYLTDYGMAYAKLRDIVGDVRHEDGSSAFKPYFRPPTLTISKAGFKALYDTNYEYIVSGSYSTHDYEQPDLDSMVNEIKAGIYDKNGKVINGAILVMHMSDQALYTATALDMLMTVNDARSDDDPAKFIPMPLSAYLKNDYAQSNYKIAKEAEPKTNTKAETATKDDVKTQDKTVAKKSDEATKQAVNDEDILYQNSGYGSLPKN